MGEAADPVLVRGSEPAYKPIEAVMAAQRDLVEPVVRLRPLGVVKG